MKSDVIFFLPRLSSTGPNEGGVIAADDSEEMLNFIGRIQRDHSHSLSLTEGQGLVPCHVALTLSPTEDVSLATELNGGAAAGSNWAAGATANRCWPREGG